MKPRSGKNKAIRLQNTVAEVIRCKYKLETHDVKPAIMGETGVDIQFSKQARWVCPFDIECKNTEKLNIWSAIEQAEENRTADDRIPIVVFKRNRSEIYCVLKFEDLIRLDLGY